MKWGISSKQCIRLKIAYGDIVPSVRSSSTVMQMKIATYKFQKGFFTHASPAIYSYASSQGKTLLSPS